VSIALLHTGRRLGVVLVTCCLAGPSAFADDSTWSRFAAMVSGEEPAKDEAQLPLDAPDRFPVADAGNERLCDQSAMLTPDAPSLAVTSPIAAEDSFFAQDRTRQSGPDEADVPLSMLAPSLGWYLTEKLQLTVTDDDPSGSYGDYGGTILGLRLGLRYRVLENVGVGVGYDMLDVNAAMNAGATGLVNYRQWGPTAFLSMRF